MRKKKEKSLLLIWKVFFLVTCQIKLHKWTKVEQQVFLSGIPKMHHLGAEQIFYDMPITTKLQNYKDRGFLLS